MGAVSTGRIRRGSGTAMAAVALCPRGDGVVMEGRSDVDVPQRPSAPYPHCNYNLWRVPQPIVTIVAYT